MAEKFTIFEADIDMTKATKAVEVSRKAVNELKKGLKELTDAEKANNKALDDQNKLLKSLQESEVKDVKLISETQAGIDKLLTVRDDLNASIVDQTAVLKVNQEELKRNETQTKNLIVATEAQEGSMKQMKAQLALVSAEWNDLSEEERKNTDRGKELTAEKKRLSEALLKEEKATGTATRQVGFYERGMGDATQAATQFVPGAGKAAAAAKTLGVAFKVMLGPIGLIIAVIGAVVAAVKSFFTSSEEGQDALARFGATFKVIFGNISDILSKFGKAIVYAFTQPKQAIQDLKDMITDIKDFFVNTFGNIIGGVIDGFVANFLKSFAYLELGWHKLKGVFTENDESVKETTARIEELGERSKAAGDRVVMGAKNLAQAVKDGYNSAKDAISGFIEEQKKEMAIAQQLADQQAALNKQERATSIQNAKDLRDIQKNLVASKEKENRTTEERLAMLNKAFALEEEILQRNLDIAKQKLEIKTIQNSLSNSTREDLEEQARLQVELINLETASFSKRKEMEGQRQTLISEGKNKDIAEAKAAAERAVELMDYELKQYLAANRTKLGYTDETLRSIATMEQAANQEAYDRGLKSLEEFNIEKQRIQGELDAELNARRLDALQLNYENELALAESDIFAKLELQRSGLESQLQQELEYAELIGADTSLIRDKYRQMDLDLDRAKEEAKLDMYAGFASNIATIAGETTAVGKAAAATATVINTYKAAMSAFADTPGGVIIKGAAALAATVTGIATLKKILATDTNIASGSTGSASISPTTVAPQQALTPQLGSTSVSTQFATSAAAGVKGVSDAQQPVLVTDAVTAKQMQQSTNRGISAI